MSVLVSAPAPDFKMQAVVDGGKFQEVKLSDYKGKWLVLFFYTLDFSSLCPTEITGFRDKLSEFKKLNAAVVGVSVDSHFAHLNWIQTQLKDLGFPLASDLTKDVSRRYGVLLEDKGISLRGTFIIDPDGIIKWAAIGDLTIGRSIDETLRVLSAAQTGEFCQANWKPGQKTLGK